MLSLRQSWYLEELRQKSSHPVEVVEEPAEGEGIITILMTFPGLYLDVSSEGSIICTRNIEKFDKDASQQ